MRNEVYGTITLDVSMPTSESNGELAILQTAYKMHDGNFNKNMLDKMKIHNVDINWEKFFGEDE